ncbi:flavodoxin [Lactobacillus pentosus]|nr:flavodoxin [Lactiplantibacillus pentosus]MCT3293019.1 flavodoxin [Lactiplantibacillus pentosus]MPQ18440.1 flavodoxin [Lactiplantibacillus pentosus]
MKLLQGSILVIVLKSLEGGNRSLLKHIIVVYYSWSGNTAKAAREIAAQAHVSPIELTVADDTFSADMYATATIAQHQIETDTLPQLTNVMPSVSPDDIVLVGGPVWHHSVATPVRQFLRQIAGFKGIVAPFYTHTGTPGTYEAEIAQLIPTAQVKSGLAVDRQTTTPQILQWLKTVAA